MRHILAQAMMNFTYRDYINEKACHTEQETSIAAERKKELFETTRLSHNSFASLLGWMGGWVGRC